MSSKSDQNCFVKYVVQFDQSKAKIPVTLPIQGKTRECKGLNKSDRSLFPAL